MPKYARSAQIYVIPYYVKSYTVTQKQSMRRKEKAARLAKNARGIEGY
jgi:hypothetical protein